MQAHENIAANAEKQPNILVIEDDESILELIRYILNRQGILVTGAFSGEEGLKLAQEYPPDLVILDLMLPGLDGLEVCRRLRGDESLSTIPILIVSAKNDEADVIMGLELGADDYICKPFSPVVLSARVRTNLRRGRAGQRHVKGQEGIVRVQELEINPARFEVKLSGQPLILTLDEYRLLWFLVQHPGWAFSRAQIMNGMKGEHHVVTERAVDVRISGLRKRLGKYGDYIETIRGVGYRFRTH